MGTIYTEPISDPPGRLYRVVNTHPTLIAESEDLVPIVRPRQSFYPDQNTLVGYLRSDDNETCLCNLKDVCVGPPAEGLSDLQAMGGHGHLWPADRTVETIFGCSSSAEPTGLRNTFRTSTVSLWGGVMAALSSFEALGFLLLAGGVVFWFLRPSGVVWMLIAWAVPLFGLGLLLGGLAHGLGA